MSTTVKKQRRIQIREEDSGFFPPEITIKTKAARNIISAAEAMGILGRLLEQLSRRCGIIFSSTANSPCQIERRKNKWHGQEDQEKGTEFLDRIDKEVDGESAQYDQMALKIIKRLERKPKPKNDPPPVSLDTHLG